MWLSDCQKRHENIKFNILEVFVEYEQKIGKRFNSYKYI